MKINQKVSLGFIAFLQAVGLVVYCSLVGLLIWRGEKWFGPVTSFFGPVLFLVLFVVSALICGFLALGYPIYLFWEKKQRTQALKIAAATTAWLLFFVCLFILILVSC